ncbi:MAG TPA: bifunctional DNA-binding transcriptional regulator/O6-methylguanine-DNA methyltransferase Ada [Verrucomicrobiae bacterium]|nr:bifunctional DNA-binding transcriptional regulator/O6-methylguanine-DNA methyltransferase Ada [Verrucomicrobiae bacterium]
MKKIATVAGRWATDAERWDAVVRRDAGADGQFYYSVATTGVYCRPGCGSRRPRRENVQFYFTPAEAERAGFRACKRCRPTSAGPESERMAKVIAACRRIEAAEEPPRLEVLARAAGLSRFHFHRLFVRLTGVTPRAYAKAQRARRVRAELGRRSTVTEAIYQAGFNSNGRFYAESSRMLGMTPKQFRRHGAGEVIRFAVGECALGSILVAASTKGICAISLGDDAGGLVEELRRRFSKAELVAGDKSFGRLVAGVIGLVEKPGKGWNLPLDIRGTAFQRRVWQALQEIPFGATSNYSEIARRIGAPKSVRAVAGACAANPIAVAIPCHRVLRRGGQLSGYRWGVARKRALLRRERS